MKKLRKSSSCLNCETPLAEVFRYCPSCGQENTDNTVSLKELFQDLFSSYVNLDSKFFRTIKPLLLTPWILSRSFVEGKRVMYLHPLKMYLGVSLIFFSTLNYFFVPKFQKVIEEKIFSSSDGGIITIHSDEEKEKNGLTSLPIDSLNSKLNVMDSIKEKYHLNDSLNPFQEDLFENSAFVSQNLGLMPNKESYLQRVHRLSLTEITPEILCDSLDLPKNFFGRSVSKQLMKIGRNDVMIYVNGVISYMSVMMLCLLVVYAFYLKMLYFFSFRLYMQHFIFSLHLLTFCYIVASLGMLMIVFFNMYAMFGIVALLCMMMALLMFKNFYKQSWIFTIFKFMILSFLYSVTSLLFFAVEIIVSFFLF